MKIFVKHLFILLFLGFIPCGCDNDPASPQEEHTDADGFILEDATGNEIYREFQGATMDSVTISVGQTLELSVHFLDHDGNEIEHEEGEEEEHEEGRGPGAAAFRGREPIRPPRRAARVHGVGRRGRQGLRRRQGLRQGQPKLEQRLGQGSSERLGQGRQQCRGGDPGLGGKLRSAITSPSTRHRTGSSTSSRKFPPTISMEARRVDDGTRTLIFACPVA